MTVQDVAAQPTAAQAGFNSADFRSALGAFATGVTVITSRATITRTA